MTVSKSISEWLKGYAMKAVKVSTDQVGEGADSLGIFKSPNRETEEYNDNSYKISEHYQLFVVREGQEQRDREDTVARVLPYWQVEIAPQIAERKTVLIAAHGNSLRALIMHLEELSPEKIIGCLLYTSDAADD